MESRLSCQCLQTLISAQHNGRDYQWGGFVEGSYRFDLTGEQSLGFAVRRAEWDDKAGTKNATATKNNIHHEHFCCELVAYTSSRA